MTMRVLGCSHHNTTIAVREQLAFSPEQARSALLDAVTKLFRLKN